MYFHSRSILLAVFIISVFLLTISCDNKGNGLTQLFVESEVREW